MNATTCTRASAATTPAHAGPTPNPLRAPGVAPPDCRSEPADAAGAERIVYVVDGDGEACRALRHLLTAAGYVVRAFANEADYLNHARPDINSCLLAEAGSGGALGLRLLRRRIDADPPPPAVLMTACGGDMAVAVSAMKAGAVDVLAKPLVRQHVLDAVATALGADRQRRARRGDALATLQRGATLTPRERQVMALVTSGLMNKQVANALCLSEISVKIHRGNLMKKMGVRTLPDLVRAADLLSLHT